MFIFYEFRPFCIDNARVIYRKIRYFIFLERPRSSWEVHAEPLRLRAAQVGNLCSRHFVETVKNIESLIRNWILSLSFVMCTSNT